MIGRFLVSTFSIAVLSSSSFAGTPEVVKTIAVGGGPTSLAVDVKGNRVFVANAFENKVAVIGEKTVKGKKELRVIEKIKTKARMLDVNMGGNGIAYDPESERVFLPDLDNSFIILDAKKYEPVRSVPNKKGENGWMSAVYFDRGLKEIVALDWYGFIQVYDRDGKKKREFDTGIKGIKYYAVTGEGTTMYVSKGQKLFKVSMRSGTVVTEYDIPTHAVPVMDEKGYVYAGGSDGSIYKITEIPEPRVLEFKGIGFPEYSGTGMGYNPNTGRLFVPSGEEDLAVIDTGTMKEVARFKVGKLPRSIAVNTKTNTVFVACAQAGRVVVIQDK